MDEKDTVVDSRPAPTGPERPWERELLTRLAFASLNEQRRTRRWGIFFKTLTLAYLFLLLVIIFVPGDGALTKTAVGRHTALIEVKGIIADDMEASADNVISSLRAAFDNNNAAGVILRINSPGGSPVQAGYINDEIRRLRELHPDTPLYAVVTDICASGGYYIAAAADEIYADKASLVGSIGVLSNGFGFVDSLEKLGVERRLHTAGENKGFMDPFSPERPQDVKHLKKVLNGIHEQFIDAVRVGRGDRLKENDKLFSGLVWTGEQSVALGLVDGLGSSSYVARDLIGEEDIVDYTARPRFFEQFVDRLGASMANALSTRLGLSDFEIR